MPRELPAKSAGADLRATIGFAAKRSMEREIQARPAPPLASARRAGWRRSYA
jgi:hypothetical protein